MKNLLPLTHWGPHSPGWLRNLSTPHLFAFLVILGVGLPFIMTGILGFVFWFLGYLLFQPMFWASLGALVIAAIFAG